MGQGQQTTGGTGVGVCHSHPRLAAVAVNAGGTLPSGTRAAWSVQPDKGNSQRQQGTAGQEREARRHGWVGG